MDLADRLRFCSFQFRIDWTVTPPEFEKKLALVNHEGKVEDPGSE
jgi:hypothetical protein